jgi:lipopolysaccharide transport system ATP-binding protein
MTAIRFDHVSKKFALRRERPHSFQELFLNLVRLRGRSSRPEPYWVLTDVSFELQKGEVVGFIGPNGAGKSTVLKLMSRIIEPTSGRVEVNGRLGALLELGAGFHPDLTGRENIFLNGSILGLSHDRIRQKLDQIIDFAELDMFIDVPVKHYSSGMYVRLGFSIAVHTDPEIVLIDEVLAVGDARFQHKCLDTIAELRREGLAIVLVSHDLGSIQSLCEKAIWLEDGQIQASGQPSDVVMSYLNRVADEENLDSRSLLPKLDIGNRWGTGKVQVTGVELLDGKGQPSRVFLTGTCLEIRLHYTSAEQVEDPIFGISIHHQNGMLVCGPNTSFSDVRISVLQGEGVLAYHIPSLSLLEGTYQVSVSCHKRDDTEMYDYHDRAYSFRIFPGKSLERYGFITTNGQWQTGQASPGTCASRRKGALEGERGA